ncbi:uncharacterized protein LOC126766477 [Bactrocera neohumeralis]|uniref:uncharacterized protein LOC126766477 n=1 Tax=Bactrocera neohumeralis TaxID=98809 RepID=UPI002165BB02|nr:uncharacterized protein LOC126766477 [Bactrocera neohumeralis]
MYRSKKAKGKKSDKSAMAEIHDAAADTAAAELAAIKEEFGSVEGGPAVSGLASAKSQPPGAASAPSHKVADAATAQAIVNFKASFTTPSMVFNPSTKTIEVNARFNRNTVTELSRAQGAMLSVLRGAEAKAKFYTPKELLYGLEQAILLPTLESYFAHHTAPAKSIAATAYALSEGLSRRAVESFVQTLSARIEEEADPIAEKQRSLEEKNAFAATRNNVTDFTQIFSNFLVAYEGVPRAASSANPSLSNVNTVSAGSQCVSADLLSEAYYSLLRWTLAVDPERKILLAQQQQQQQPASASSKVIVDEYDPYEGRITLARPTSTTPWGCMFNAKGYLVGISNNLRNNSEAGERLFRALQQHSGKELGVPVLEANRRRIRAQDMSEEELQSQRGNITAGLRDSLTSDAKVLRLTVPRKRKKSLTSPREVLFELLSQGGENVSGQRVFLVLRRANTTIPWGVKMVKDSTGGLKLQEFSDRIHLSPKAKDFLFEHRGGLTIVGLNHKDLADHPEAATGATLRELISNSLVMALWLQVNRSTDAVTHGLPASEAAAPAPAEEDAAEVKELEGVEEAEEPKEAEEAEKAEADAEDNEAVEHANEEDLDEEKLEIPAAAEDEAEVAAARETVTETVTATASAMAQNTAQTVASIRKGWDLHDDVEEDPTQDAKPMELAEGDAIKDEEAEHRKLLEEHDVAADTDEAHAVDGDGEVELIEGQFGFANNATHQRASTDIETAVQDILDAEGSGDLVDTEGKGVTATAGEEGEVAPKKRGRKPGSKNATTKTKAKKGKGREKSKGKGKRGKKSTSQPEAEEAEVAEGDKAEEAADEEAKEAVEERDEKKVPEASQDAVDTATEEPLVKGLKTTAEIAMEEGGEAGEPAKKQERKKR